MNGNEVMHQRTSSDHARGMVHGGGYGSGIAQMASMPETIPRARELPDQLQQLAKAQEYLEHTVNELESRLGPMTRSSPPQMVGDPKLASAPPATEYGADLYERVQRTTRTADRLQDLIRRLEA